MTTSNFSISPFNDFEELANFIDSITWRTPVWVAVWNDGVELGSLTSDRSIFYNKSVIKEFSYSKGLAYKRIFEDITSLL